MATKRQLIAGMTLDNAAIAHERPIMVHYYTQERLGRPAVSVSNGLELKWELAWYFLPNPTEHLRIISHGYVAYIFSSGRVTLDVFGMTTPCGELFDAQVKDGLTLQEIRTEGVKLLHAAIRKSGLN